MQKTMVFGLLFFITFLAIKECIGSIVCPTGPNNIPVNSNDDNLIDEYFSIFICCYQKQLMGKVDQFRILSASLDLHGPN